MSVKPLISIIIVSYNVRDFLEQALISIKRALAGISAEIFVVDNASVDGSAEMVKKKFTDILLIESLKNIGFSAGNNLAIKKAQGDFIVLINPDTIVQEDTFTKLLEFFKVHPEASAATCKILNPDGSFSIDCRHSVPTPITAFWKIMGLNRLFPKSKIFGKYNLTYLDENEINKVEAISGSFMMIRKDIIDKIGLLDEIFFMYCEDIDFCYRINQSGGEIYYVPDSQIIHYKGESTKNNNLDYIITFNKSLYLFYKKHYHQKYIYPFKWLIFLGVLIRGLIIFFKNNLRLYYPVLLDLILLNLNLILSFIIRFNYRGGFHWKDFFDQYIVINAVSTLAYFLFALFHDTLSTYRYSISKIIKANLSAFTFVSALTFFLKQFAFSRLVVLVSAAGSIVAMMFWRIIFRYFARKTETSILSNQYFLKRTLIVGSDEETRNLIKKLNERIQNDIQIIGIVSPDIENVGSEFEGIPVVTAIENIDDYLTIRRADLVIFSIHNISFESILKTMSKIGRQRVEFKMAPGHLEYIIGKSSVEKLDTLPLIDIEYAYGRLFNKFAKRGFDLFFGLMFFILFLPLNLFIIHLWFKKISVADIYTGPETSTKIFRNEKNKLFGFILNLLNIILGRLSLVGAPIALNPQDAPSFEYKPGIFSLVNLNKNKIQTIEQKRNLELHYLKSQNLIMDLEIIFRSILKN